MLLGRVRQQPNETRRYLLDFGKLRLNTGEYITACLSAVSPDTVPVITSSVVLIEGTQGDPTTVRSAWLYVGGGVDGTTYKITLTTIPDDVLLSWEDELEILVEDL